MTTEYIAYPWPEYQEYMGEEWFREECYYCADKDIYFIPINRVNTTSTDNEIRKDIISNLKIYIKCIKDGYDAPSAKNFVVKEIEKQITWLEKKDDKPQGKTAFEAAKEEKVDNKNCVKSADDIKPKFKIGDWIIDGYVCGQITSIEDDYPCYKIIDFMIGTNTSIPFTIQDKYHLWTIQDAKDGDVIQLGKVTAIFQKCIGNNCKCYCSVCDGEFEIPSQDGDDNIYGCYNATPATKEQHDFLFAKIKEAGYIFDFKNKELKKIEDEIEIPFGAKDSELQEATYYIPKGFYAEIDDDKVVIKKGEKPTAWSEEDDAYKLFIISAVEDYYDEKNPLRKDLVNWLKSIKQRIGG